MNRFACVLLLAVIARPLAGQVTWADPIRGGAPKVLAARNPFNAAPLTGAAKKYIILGCRYSDGANPWDIAQASAMFNTDPVSVKGFYLEVSNNQFTLTADASDWQALPSPKATYVSASSGSADLGAIADECVSAHDPTVDFSQYDGIVFQMSSDLGCCAVASQYGKTIDGVTNKLFHTIFVPGNIASPKGIAGTYIHEIGHNLGLLHTASADEGAYNGNWNVMANAFTGDEGGARFGAQFLAAQKEQLGWIPRARVFLATGATSTITLERNAAPGDNANYQVAFIPLGTSERFYALELRKAVAGTYDRVVPREGVFIHDWYQPFTIPFGSKIVDADGNGDSNDDGIAWVAGETFIDARNRISVTINSVDATSANVTIRNGRGVVFSAASSGMKRTLVAGSAPALDSIAIQAEGATGGSLAWTAGHANPLATGTLASWVRLTNPSGAGSGQLRVRHDPGTLGPGTYVDSFAVTSALLDKRIVVYDTLVVTAPATLNIGLSVRSRSDSGLVPFQSQANALVTVTGPGASSAAWTLAARRGNTLLGIRSTSATAGVGNDSVRWVRNFVLQPYAAPGTYVDTITVTLDGTSLSAMVVDTLTVLPVVQFTSPLKRGKKITTPVGSPPVLDSVEVTFAGQHATSAEWFVRSIGPGGAPKANFFMEPHKNYNRHVLGVGVWRGVGNGWVKFWRGNRELTAGTYIDTLHIQGPFYGAEGNASYPGHQGTTYIIDTLELTASARSISFAPAFKYDTVYQGMSNTTDSIQVIVVGEPARTNWIATARGSYAVMNYMGTLDGRGKNVSPNALSWQRAVTGLAPGLYVDTIDVRINDAGPLTTAFFVDTFVVMAPAAIQVPVSRVTRRTAGWPNASDSMTVSLVGSAAASVAWTATKRQSWTTLNTAIGTGSGTVRWTRASESLAAGVYVDTITVASDNGSVMLQRFIDTLLVLPPLAVSVSHQGRRSAPGGTLAVTDSVTVTISNGSFNPNWTATKRKAWTALRSAVGSGTSKLFWTKAAGTLPPGTYVDTLTIASDETGASASVIDTLVVAQATIVSAPASRRRNVLFNSGPNSDSAEVSFSGPLAATVTWTATKRRSSTTLTTSSGTGSGKVRWTTLATPSPQTIVDTITISPSDGIDARIIVDTMFVGSAMLTASSPSRNASAIAGTGSVLDSVTISVVGPGANGATWSATKKQSWTTLTTAQGNNLNLNKVRWRRSAGLLVPGTYVDTITITGSTGISSYAVIDTMVVTAPTVLAQASITPDSTGLVVGMRVDATLSLDLTPLAKSLADYGVTVTWDSTFMRLDSVRAVSGGFAAPTVATPALNHVTITAADPAGKSGNVALARLFLRVIADVPAGGAQSTLVPAFSFANAIVSQDVVLTPAIAVKPAKVVHVAGSLRGDLTLDGRVTQADALAVVRSIAGNPVAGSRPTPNGDANCDGKVSVLDAQIILRKEAGKDVATACVGTIK